MSNFVKEVANIGIPNLCKATINTLFSATLNEDNNYKTNFEIPAGENYYVNATQVVDGQVSFNFEVGTMNKYGAAKVGVHVVAVDANGKVSQYVTSELTVEKWVEPTE